MKIVVTGGCGYLGSVLVPKLMARGHDVKVFDRAYFGHEHMLYLPMGSFIREDLRSLDSQPDLIERLLDGCDCIIHLAAVSNDPSAELNSVLTDQVNFQSTLFLAEIAKKRGIKFVFSSSCSVYGCSDTEEMNENSALGPLTAYARSKVSAEKALLALKSPEWSPVILRNGTLFGYSPRIRFDLVVNIFSMYSTLYNQIKVFGGGEQWRPFLHVADCARAFCFFAEKKELQHSVYNVALENRTLHYLVELFQNLNPCLKVVHANTEQVDKRSYRACTERMKDEGFSPQIPISVGAEEIICKIVDKTIPDPESSFYNNVKWMKELMLHGKVKIKTY